MRLLNVVAYPKLKQHEPEADCFDNNYGFNKLAKQMQKYQNDQYLAKQHYWHNTEEGLQRLDEIRKPFETIELPNAFSLSIPTSPMPAKSIIM